MDHPTLIPLLASMIGVVVAVVMEEKEEADITPSMATIVWTKILVSILLRIITSLLINSSKVKASYVIPVKSMMYQNKQLT